MRYEVVPLGEVVHKMQPECLHVNGKKKKTIFFFFSFDAPMSHLLPLSSGQVKPLLGRFSELGPLVEPGSVDAVLLDAGCSSMQMDQANRGFSLSKDGPLDMRMDGER